MAEGVGSSEISNDSFVIVSFLISLFVGYCCFFGLVYLYHSIAIDLEIFKSRDSLDDLEVTFRVSFSALEVLQMNICKQLSALDIIRGV